MQVKLLPQDSELYVFAESADRVAKERSMRKRQLKWLWARLKELSRMSVKSETRRTAHETGAGQGKVADGMAPRRHRGRHGKCHVRLRPRPQEAATGAPARRPLSAPQQSRPRADPTTLWNYYIQLVKIEEAFKTLKGRPRNQANLSSGTMAHRSSYLHRFSRLLPARHHRPTPPGVGSRPHTTQRL